MAVLRLVAVLALFTVSEAQASSMGAPQVMSASVLAQPAPDSSVAPPPPPGEQQMPTEPPPAPAAPAAPAAPPAPAAPAAPPATENVLRPYGTFNARVVMASAAVETFNQPNAVAPTAAGHPVLANRPDESRFSLQVGQSRFGLWVNEKGTLRGQVEVDFADFTKATPTVQAVPRLRIARVDWVPAPGHTLSLGQDWDLAAPLNAHGINMVGTLFVAGNTGFMRQQLKYLHTQDAYEVGLALGFPGANATAKDAAFELGFTPTVAVRGAYKSGASRVGASVLATRLTYALGTPQERRSPSYQGTLFAELVPTPATSVRVELNFGQNTANLGMLSLSQGRADKDMRDVGGFVSARQTFRARHAVYAMAGLQRALQRGDVVPAYAYPTVPEGQRPPISTAALSGTGPGMHRNGAVRLGYEFKPGSALALVVEGFLYQSHHALQAPDAEEVGGGGGRRRAVGLETGMLLSF
jgi:hypothetical protein